MRPTDASSIFLPHFSNKTTNCANFTNWHPRSIITNLNYELPLTPSHKVLSNNINNNPQREQPNIIKRCFSCAALLMLFEKGAQQLPSRQLHGDGFCL